MNTNNNRTFFYGALFGFLLGGLFVWLLFWSMQTIGTSEGFYWTGHEDMPFQVQSFGSKIYYIGGNRYAQISSRWGNNVAVHEFTGDRPSPNTLQSVFDHCFREVVRENMTIGKAEFTTGSTTYACQLIKSVSEVVPGQTYALYPYEAGEEVTVWAKNDTDFAHSITIPAGSIVQILEVKGTFGPILVRYNDENGAELWINNDVVKFVVPEP